MQKKMLYIKRCGMPIHLYKLLLLYNVLNVVVMVVAMMKCYMCAAAIICLLVGLLCT